MLASGDPFVFSKARRTEYMFITERLPFLSVSFQQHWVFHSDPVSYLNPSDVDKACVGFFILLSKVVVDTNFCVQTSPIIKP